VLRVHRKQDQYFGPRYYVRLAYYAFHPKDTQQRALFAQQPGGIGLCNITKCCTEVCPEHIRIRENSIIPLKELVADEQFDPFRWLWQRVTRRGRRRPAP
jgi:succinate dehydrogenase / fumarate reductase iron-sulfur subunit